MPNTRRSFLICFLLAFLIGQFEFARAQDAPRPNILWITSEDNGPELGCYGDEYATTPFIDGLAARGMCYENCWSNAPVCAPARTTIITGMYPTSLGGQHMRSQVKLPSVAKLYPEYLRELGYYCTNNSKTDYNVEAPQDLWNDSSKKAHWRNRKQGQPFFAVFNFTISHESKIRTRPHKAVHDPADVTVPPFHPDTPEVRQDWAQYYDQVSAMDTQVGQVLAQLKEDGLEEETIIFYYGDHGTGMPRGKRWLYQTGLRVPMIVHVPDRFADLVEDQYKSGSSSERLISFVDLVPTVLSLLGQPAPTHLHGKAFLGPHATEDPQYIYGFRDRMDERIDMSRAVRDERYAYIRNFYPDRPQGTYLDYMFQTPTTQKWKALFDAGELDAAQSTFWEAKPPEELYDLQADPYQVNNLAGSAEHEEVLERMRAANRSWMLEIKDIGLLPEGEMLARAGEAAPYELAHGDDAVDLEAIYEAADLATRGWEGENDAKLDALMELRTASENAARYWLARGLLLRAKLEATNELLSSLRGLSNDTSPYVRCSANEALARFGTPSDRSAAVRQLLNLADTREYGLFVAMAALNSMDWCKLTEAEVENALEGIPGKSATVPTRYHSYVPKLLNRVGSTLEP